MKTKEELNALKQEVNSLNEKLAELSEDELKEVTGGSGIGANPTVIWGSKPILGIEDPEETARRVTPIMSNSENSRNKYEQ